MVYIGDMGGQLWRWVVSDPDPDNWPFQKVLQAEPFTYTHPVTGDGMTYWRNFFFPPTGLLRNGVLWLGVGTGERHNLKFEGIDVDGDGEPDVANDGLRGLPLDETRRNLFEMTDRFQAAGAKVLLAGMTLPRNYGPDYIRDFEKIFSDLKREKNVACFALVVKRAKVPAV